ncbi:MAG: hypothetical protein ACRCUZ_03865, partial [Shewanella sp.]
MTLTWLKVDGIYYQSVGNEIICRAGQVFSCVLPGTRLEQIELDNSDGELAGWLTVDFSAQHLQFIAAPDAAQITDLLVIGDAQEQLALSVYALGTFDAPQVVGDPA